MNAKIIAITNQKGGVDADPQGSLSISLGHLHPDMIGDTLATLMGKVITDTALEPKEGTLQHHEGVDLLPANIELSGKECKNGEPVYLTKMGTESLLCKKLMIMSN